MALEENDLGGLRLSRETRLLKRSPSVARYWHSSKGLRLLRGCLVKNDIPCTRRFEVLALSGSCIGVSCLDTDAAHWLGTRWRLTSCCNRIR